MESTLDIKVSVKDGKACEKILKIEVPQESINKEYAEYYRAVADKAKIPGFRPGKAPREVLEMHFKNDARQAVLKNLISESYREAVQQKELHPLGFPDIEDVTFDDRKLSYQAKIETRPKIKLSKVAGLSAKKQTAEVKPEEVEEALKRVQNSLAQFKAVENRAAEKGDTVIADYVCLVDGKEVEKRNDDWFEIQEEEYLKGFSIQMIGLKAGDEKDITVTFPEQFGRKEMAGKPAVFKLKVKELKTKALPELNDELAQSAGEFKTLAELKEKIESEIRTSKERQFEVEFENALLDELVKNNKLELPEGLIKRRTEKLVEDELEHQHRHGGAHHDHAGDPDHKKLRETLAKELEPQARKQIHIAFLLDEIADTEKITVAEEEIKEKINAVAVQVRQPLATVEKYYQEHEEAMQSLHDQIRNEKTIEHIKKNAKIN